MRLTESALAVSRPKHLTEPRSPNFATRKRRGRYRDTWPEEQAAAEARSRGVDAQASATGTRDKQRSGSSSSSRALQALAGHDAEAMEERKVEEEADGEDAATQQAAVDRRHEAQADEDEDDVEDDEARGPLRLGDMQQANASTSQGHDSEHPPTRSAAADTEGVQEPDSPESVEQLASRMGEDAMAAARRSLQGAFAREGVVGEASSVPATAAAATSDAASSSSAQHTAAAATADAATMAQAASREAVMAATSPAARAEAEMQGQAPPSDLHGPMRINDDFDGLDSHGAAAAYEMAP